MGGIDGMKNLQQEKYEDDNGHEIGASEVQMLASYVHHADGFYDWTCGSCGAEHADRWWDIFGRVIACPDCKKMNLLVRTNCAEITELARRKFESEERDLELKRLQGIEKYNDDQLLKIKREIMGLVEDAIRSHATAEKRLAK